MSPNLILMMCGRRWNREPRRCRTASLRRAIGCVSQEVFLFSGTVRESDAWGYLAVVGERGQKLSGGQEATNLHRLGDPEKPAILVLENGGVAESGTHEELVESGGLCAALWRVQTGDAVPSPLP